MLDIVWEVDSQSQDTLTGEMSVFTQQQAKMWDMVSQADDAPMPETFTTSVNTQSKRCPWSTLRVWNSSLIQKLAEIFENSEGETGQISEST
ncbi:hypothetical protein KOW79_008429 [Hemibagrus wyckioides]|uniref:Uncharacterized protein n=1 Tax=Hemibagrus wyckioides TaxID=337641 RepID=A0A9D3NWH5_9TELE|nr:hypothetical protein KOW79_008429 [Hemibagrus wyckioides]